MTERPTVEAPTPLPEESRPSTRPTVPTLPSGAEEKAIEAVAGSEPDVLKDPWKGFAAEVEAYLQQDMENQYAHEKATSNSLESTWVDGGSIASHTRIQTRLAGTTHGAQGLGADNNGGARQTETAVEWSYDAAYRAGRSS